MWKTIREWFYDLNEVERELNKQGIYNFVTLHGVWTAFVDKGSLTTQINTSDDRQETIRQNNK